MTVRVGIDAGGTFTDVCLVDENGSIAIFKLSSTPSDPSTAIINGVMSLLAETGHVASDVAYFGHGTTVATNALLERRGAPTGVITTAGFRDLLELARQRRPDLYDLHVDKPTPIVPRRYRVEVPERMRYDGTIEQPLDELAVREAVRSFREAGLKAISVCFLYSYLYPEHEERVAAIVRDEFPEAYLSLSHRVLAEFREYERLSTTVINSYIGPVMSRYVGHLRERVAAEGIPVDPRITQSNGGLISLDLAIETPVRTVLSGPAAGVTGAVHVSRQAGLDNIITFDMGGTSTDVSLIQGGRVSTRLELEIGGIPIRTPMIDINTVGAGGGSIAWIDSGNHLKVGPESAGASPGPVAYGLGGTRVTVTDANIALGILNRKSLLDGRMPIDAAAADAAVSELAERLQLAPTTLADGVLAIVTANMARAIRVISIERGYDPRDFTLVAFGGAGPLHVARLARELGIPQVLVPTVPGILCALGLLVADHRADFSRTIGRVGDDEASFAGLESLFAELERSAREWLEREGIEHQRRQIRRVIDLRYRGQNYELTLPLSGGFDGEGLRRLREQFHAAHEQSYGFASPGEPIQFVTARVEAIGDVPKAELPEIDSGGGEVGTAQVGIRSVYLREVDDWTDCRVFARAQLRAGHRFVGPAIVEQLDSTTLVLPGQKVEVDRFGNLMISEGSDRV